MSDTVEFVKAIKKTAIEAVDAQKPTSVYFGTVLQTAPIQINVEQKMVLGEQQLILARNVTDYKTKISLGGSTGSSEESHTHQITGTIKECEEPPHTHELHIEIEGAGSSHAHTLPTETEITVYNSLAKGDSVILLRVQGGQKFIVLDRIR